MQALKFSEIKGTALNYKDLPSWTSYDLLYFNMDKKRKSATHEMVQKSGTLCMYLSSGFDIWIVIPSSSLTHSYTGLGQLRELSKPSEKSFNFSASVSDTQ